MTQVLAPKLDPEFDPWGIHGGRRKQTFTSCTLTHHKSTMWYTHAPPLQEKKNVKQTKPTACSKQGCGKVRHTSINSVKGYWM